MVSLIISSLKSIISVCTGSLFGGGVFMIERSLAPRRENCSVRGIGVAVRVRVSTESLSCLRRSFAATPNFCSSSIMSSPRSLNCISLLRSLWVPITISVFPLLRFSEICLISFAVLRRLIYSILHGKSLSLLLKVL